MKRKNLTKQIDVDPKHEPEDPCWKDMHDHPSKPVDRPQTPEKGAPKDMMYRQTA